MLISLVFESAKMNKIDLDATMIGVNVPFAARLRQFPSVIEVPGRPLFVITEGNSSPRDHTQSLLHPTPVYKGWHVCSKSMVQRT